MKITYENNMEEAIFEAVQKGQVFSHESILYMKTTEIQSTQTGGLYNSARLSDGYMVRFCDYDEVFLPDVELVIHN